MNLRPKIFYILIFFFFISHSFSADYPPNIDLGSQGDFLAKRGVQYGRTTILMPIGPALVSLPEGPSSSDAAGVVLDQNDNVWDLSDLTNPILIREMEGLSEPVDAHATGIRYANGEAHLYARSSTYWTFNPNASDSNSQLVLRNLDGDPLFEADPLGQLGLTAPYFVRNFWEYNVDSQEFGIRNPMVFAPDEDIPFLGEFFVRWDHLGLTGVTGFPFWQGNLLVVASDQQNTGLAIYNTSGYRNGRVPELLSVFNPSLTEPNGNPTGIGGYWVEPYGTHKMIWAARENARRVHPAFYIVDFLDPRNPRLTCEIYFNALEPTPTNPRFGTETTNPMYVNFQDQYAYVDQFRIDIPGCEAAYLDDGQIDNGEFLDITYQFPTHENGCDASQYFRPLGQVALFGGLDEGITPNSVNEQGMCFFVSSDDPDTNPPFVSGHRPLASQTNYPVDGFVHIHIPETLRSETLVDALSLERLNTGGEVIESIPFRHQLSHTGTISMFPESDFSENTAYRVSLTGIQDYMGNEIVPYQFEFSTGDSLPDNIPTPIPTADPVLPTPEPGLPPSFDGDAYYPIQSSQMACSPSQEMEGLIWVVNPDNDSVALIEKSVNPTDFELTLNLNREIKLEYDHPTSVAQSDNMIAITYRDDDKVVFFNNQGYPVFTIDTGHGTQPVSALFINESLYVALYGSGEVVEIDPINREIIARINVGPTPKAMASFDDRLLVTRFISNSQRAEVYDLSVGDDLEFNRVIIINKITVADDLTHGSGVPNYLSGIVIESDGSRAYVTANKANVDRGQFLNGFSLDDDNTIRPMIATIDLTTNLDINDDPTTRAGTIDLDNAADPHGISFLVDGDVRVTALQGNNFIQFDDLSTNDIALVPVGSAPQTMCSNLRTLYVKNFGDRSISALDIAGFVHDGNLSISSQSISTVTEEVLNEEELLGLQLFYHARMPDLSPEGYISCASCHAGGGHDGMVWDLTNLGEGLRNTLSLNGTSGTRFGNLHWSSNFDEVQDFEIQIEQLNRAAGLIPGQTFENESPLEVITSNVSDELDALSDYISSLGLHSVLRSPFRTYTGDLSESAERGRQIFVADNCSECHVGAAFRDGRTHDVGTIIESSGSRLNDNLAAIRTPSLIQLWDSAPYFHDGSAATLTDVFNRGSHSREFSEEQSEDLLNYLLSLDRESYITDEEEFAPLEN